MSLNEQLAQARQVNLNLRETNSQMLVQMGQNELRAVALEREVERLTAKLEAAGIPVVDEPPAEQAEPPKPNRKTRHAVKKGG